MPHGKPLEAPVEPAPHPLETAAQGGRAPESPTGLPDSTPQQRPGAAVAPRNPASAADRTNRRLPRQAARTKGQPPAVAVGTGPVTLVRLAIARAGPRCMGTARRVPMKAVLPHFTHPNPRRIAGRPVATTTTPCNQGINPSQMRTVRAARDTPISGHGAYSPAHGHTIVPRGTTITVYAEHGSIITDDLGNLIESGGDTSGVYSLTFLRGEELPDYTIYPPDDLNIMGTPQTVLHPTLLSELIYEDMGPVDLAVCTYDETCPTGKVYDVNGIFDQWTGTFQPYERYGF